MALPAIELNNISKYFVIYHDRAKTLKERILRAFSKRQCHATPAEQFWALKNVQLQVAHGETVGLIGHNGSGKSTLLRLIAKIYAPSEGQVHVRGTVAPLELGLGFHPELTGEENIYLGASLHGLSRREIDRIYPKVVDFSELGGFIDVPCKNYSSGMYLRLAFALAVQIDPDILLIDEVLAVGDEKFQKKCLDKIREFKKQGKTIIFVSHSMEAMRMMCDRAYLLSHGHIMAEGAVDRVADCYRQLQSV